MSGIPQWGVFREEFTRGNFIEGNSPGRIFRTPLKKSHGNKKLKQASLDVSLDGNKKLKQASLDVLMLSIKYMFQHKAISFMVTGIFSMITKISVNVECEVGM